MDGCAVDHSDSDSGESWTLLEHLENSPAHADDAPVFQQNDLDHERTTPVHNNDDDTDGISIISDSDPETPPYDMSLDRCLLVEENPEEHNPQYKSLNALPPNNNEHQDSLRSEDDFLGDGHGKHKTYVHRRNKRLSTVLNIIMLGSVITAAGVAIGHMWGARNDCTMHSTPSVNKILSNLYKLQEENAYLRSKLKELTLMTNTQLQKKLGLDKLPVKQPRCRKMYEESLNTKNSDNIVKCVDNIKKYPDTLLESHFIQAPYEKEFISDIDKLKNIYQQNKSWLDQEISKRMKSENANIKKEKKFIKSVNLSPVDEEIIELGDLELKELNEAKVHSVKLENADNLQHKSQNTQDLAEGNNFNKSPTQRKVTYADSLKSDLLMKKHQKRETNDKVENKNKENIKRRSKKDKILPEIVQSEEDFKKDDRHVEPRLKQQKRKHDHQKHYKKQKRRNKYEQWEMKGGIMKDYDVYSITSQETENVLKSADQNYLNRDTEKLNYHDKFLRTDEIPKNKDIIEAEVLKSNLNEQESVINKESEHKDWYNKRAALRTEARKKLEKELFGENHQNNGRWYFRRMQRREQCRAKGDNSTYRKQSKRNMNFKQQH